MEERNNANAREARCKEFLAKQTTDDLGLMYDDLARTYKQAIDYVEREMGMSVAEHAIRRAQEGNCAGMFGLPFRGKAVRDFLPGKYDGVARARSGEKLLELVLNKIPTNVPLAKKVEIATAQYKASCSASDVDTDVDTDAGRVRALVSEAQLELLAASFAGTLLNVPPRPQARAKLLEGLFYMLKFMTDAAENAAVKRQGKGSR